MAIAVDLAHARKYIKDPHELAAQTGRALQARGKGRFYVQQALKKKGLPALHLDSEQELANCQELLSRRFHGHDLSQTAVRVKAFRYLTSRGFDSETVNKALKNWRALSQTEEDVAL